MLGLCLKVWVIETGVYARTKNPHLICCKAEPIYQKGSFLFLTKQWTLQCWPCSQSQGDVLQNILPRRAMWLHYMLLSIFPWPFEFLHPSHAAGRGGSSFSVVEFAGSVTG